MTTTKHTEASVLAHHGIAPLVGISDDKRTDLARSAGLIFACLGCGSVGGINPEGGETARQLTRDYAPEGSWECCVDDVTCVY